MKRIIGWVNTNEDGGQGQNAHKKEDEGSRFNQRRGVKKLFECINTRYDTSESRWWTGGDSGREKRSRRGRRRGHFWFLHSLSLPFLPHYSTNGQSRIRMDNARPDVEIPLCSPAFFVVDISPHWMLAFRAARD